MVGYLISHKLGRESFGLLVQGYRAEVLILDDNKFNTKVDVYLFKD